MDRRIVRGIVAGVLAGGAVGAGLALLLAPQSGRKTRKEIQNRADDLRERADKFVAEIKERGEAFMKAVREGTDNYRKEMMAKIR